MNDDLKARAEVFLAEPEMLWERFADEGIMAYCATDVEVIVRDLLAENARLRVLVSDLYYDLHNLLEQTPSLTEQGERAMKQAKAALAQTEPTKEIKE